VTTVNSSALAGDRDDHPRNHGFLRTSDGCRLAPDFDMTPARELCGHATAIGRRASDISVEDLLAVRCHFGLVTDAARGIVDAVAEALVGWREVASDTGVARAEQDRVGQVTGLPAAADRRRT
jgi:serine/threonine-protein kinase HipA